MAEVRSAGADGWMQTTLNVYLGVFLVYMFMPLVIMVIAGFNAHPQPSVTRWDGFTLHWFHELWNDRGFWEGITNSLIIGAGVMLLSVPLGLAAALMLTRMRLSNGAKSLVYGILVSPVLAPGILLGISTLIFWQNFGLAGGKLLATFGQTSFVAAYCMLLFMARLQRFDQTQEEAALDLGASHVQVFFKILLPFMRPAILTAAVLAFLQSLENYNTTVFAIGGDRTLMIEIASNVRHGLTPKVNALAVVLIGLTVVLAVAYEVHRRAERARASARMRESLMADSRIAEESVPVGNTSPAPAPA